MAPSSSRPCLVRRCKKTCESYYYPTTHYPHPRQFIPVLRVLPKHVNLSHTHAEGQLSISMQSAVDAMDVRVNDVRASSTVYEYVLDLAKALKDGAYVSLVRVWR